MLRLIEHQASDMQQSDEMESITDEIQRIELEITQLANTSVQDKELNKAIQMYAAKLTAFKVQMQKKQLLYGELLGHV